MNGIGDEWPIGGGGVLVALLLWRLRRWIIGGYHALIETSIAVWERDQERRKNLRLTAINEEIIEENLWLRELLASRGIPVPPFESVASTPTPTLIETPTSNKPNEPLPPYGEPELPSSVG